MLLSIKYILASFIFLLIFILTIVNKFFKNKEFYKKAALLPGPRIIPLLGNIHLFFRIKSNFMNTVYEMYDSYPSVFRLWIFNFLLVVIYDPKTIKVALESSKLCEKPKFYKYFELCAGKGIFTADVPVWRMHRKLMLPAIKTLHKSTEVFQKHSVIVLKYLSIMANGEEFHLANVTFTYVLNTLLEAIVGEDVFLELEMKENYATFMEKGVDSASYKILTSMLKTTEETKMINTNDQPMYNFLKNIVHQRRKLIIQNDNRRIRNTFLDLLLERTFNENELTEEDVWEEIKAIISAAIHTTPLTAAFALRIMASLPEIQSKARREIDKIFDDADDEGRKISNEDLFKMDYLDRVIKETMRLFPGAPTICRTVTEDFNTGEHILPKGSTLFIPIFHIHRIEKFWPNPLKFDPDRFLPNEIANRPSISYLPFSSGLRNCIGNKFSSAALKMLLSMVLRNYRLECNDKTPIGRIKVEDRTLLKPLTPLKIKIKKFNYDYDQGPLVKRN
ncbi:cytochrome P450 4g15-like [Leptopilina heterotoma]|uniref:cytochrome P450 4g15-like n=1 Tax=Leptopilina heterotoma TaxID=63436 RepID=UPI001CA83C8E|nr:cytochrome P450 4g15-like [Leptopilina heterotoma]